MGVTFFRGCLFGGPTLYERPRFELASGFDDRAFLREVALHIRLQHHNILELKAAFVDESCGYLHFDRHPCDLGQWASASFPADTSIEVPDGYPSAAVLLSIIQQMASAIEHMHLLDVVHGDVKPSNYVITASHVPLLLDFELCRQAATDRCTTMVTVLQGNAWCCSSARCLVRRRMCRSTAWASA
mmetsp:Transcript_22841/g.73830  ORF Transcript_22841/g.73830 Transcript_22841/m.73830 type:complete len:186 (+) Transcript_22841:74-631(+)